jgi:hypothetical protein
MWDEDTAESDNVYNQPLFNPYLKQHAKARMDSYRKELESSYRGAENGYFTEAELNKLASQIGSVATGLDNQPKKKKLVMRNLDDDWQA